MAVKVGDVIGDFTLKNQNEKDINTAELTGKRILVSFHPLAWTGICAKQMKDMDDLYMKFKELDTVALGVSIDSIYAKKPWADSLNISKLDLVGDFWPHGALAKKFGIFLEEKGWSGRANFILDADRKVIFEKVYGLDEQPDFSEVVKFLEDNK